MHYKNTTTDNFALLHPKLRNSITQLYTADWIT